MIRIAWTREMSARETADALRARGRPIVIATHPRSGTHLLIDLFRKQFRECRSWKLMGENLNRLFLSLEALFNPSAPAPISDRKAVRVLGRVERPLVKTHRPLPEIEPWAVDRMGERGRVWASWLAERASFLYLYRDGRDVLRSWHQLSGRSDASARCTLGEFIRQIEGGVSRARAWAEHVRRSLEWPGVIPVRQEDIVREPRALLERFARDLELTPRYEEPLLPRKLRNQWHWRWVRLVGVRPEGAGGLVREGGAPHRHWSELLSHDDRAFFHQEAGEMLVRLGYETSVDWVETAAR
jgi:hypothetical protein